MYERDGLVSSMLLPMYESTGGFQVVIVIVIVIVMPTVIAAYNTRPAISFSHSSFMGQLDGNNPFFKDIDKASPQSTVLRQARNVPKSPSRPDQSKHEDLTSQNSSAPYCGIFKSTLYCIGKVPLHCVVRRLLWCLGWLQQE
jgi:hypothetical protein